MSSSFLDTLIYQLWRPSDRGVEAQVFAILDSARDEKIYPMLTESDAEFLCLFRGEAAENLADVAPYVVKLEQHAPFTQWLFINGWGKSWGILAESSASLRELTRHFRSFLTVYDNGGAPLHFRYYDPRVFRVYLPTCIEKELRIIFGPVGRYHVEGEESETLVEYSFTGSNLSQNVTRLGKQM